MVLKLVAQLDECVGGNVGVPLRRRSIRKRERKSLREKGSH